MSTIVVIDGSALLELRHPFESDALLNLNLLSEAISESVYALPYADEASPFLSVHMSAPLRTVNRNNPLVREALSAKYLDQKSELQEFAVIASRCLSAPQTAEILSGADPKIGRWQRNVGYSFEKVDWQSVVSDLHPPYKIRTADSKSIEVTGEDFVRWANAEVNPEE